ncbi:hypothetical protein [Halomarina litorea]|uniref:hypothetical protein n=1 Tax=Halomarina litorea TaxID=2961595 RepID=UPI0020C2A142|nr:hypothetical protein [Halomarina sp. BCD28]
MRRPATGGRRIGIVCNADHDVFRAVADGLRDHGHEVTFFHPGRPVPERDIDRLDLLANKKVSRAAVEALQYAERTGVRTWNGYYAVLLGARFVGLRALEAVGFRVPPASTTKPDCEYVVKSLVDWYGDGNPHLGGDGEVYQKYVPADPIDDKYYAVDVGGEVRVRAVRARSKLYGEKALLGTVDPDPALAAKTRALLRAVGAQALGVDVVHADGVAYAVDVNPAMSFRGVGMDEDLVESVLARLPATDAVVPDGDADATVRTCGGYSAETRSATSTTTRSSTLPGS